jgi:hypothetical protein
MSPSIWGPPIWNFLHTLASKIKEDKYTELSGQLFFYIQKICTNLPCPECSQHARQFLGKVIFKRVSTKSDLINLLFLFHNAVNKRKVKPQFPIEGMGKYSQGNLIQAYNQFIVAFNTKGNMKLLADSFQRKLILGEFKKWILQNLQHFDR